MYSAVQNSRGCADVTYCRHFDLNKVCQTDERVHLEGHRNFEKC